MKKIRILEENECWVNNKTGEVIEVKEIQQSGDFNFNKIWLSILMQLLDCIGNKKTLVINYLLQNKNSDNLIIGTQRQIATQVGVSLPVVHDTIKAMISINAIKKTSIGVYQLNPNMIFKGKHQNRMNVLFKYQNTK